MTLRADTLTDQYAQIGPYLHKFVNFDFSDKGSASESSSRSLVYVIAKSRYVPRSGEAEWFDGADCLAG